MPTVFCAVVLYLHAVQQVDAPHVAAAWAFFALRVLHSAVHCTFNYIPLRFSLYVLSSAALWFMVARAAYVALA